MFLLIVAWVLSALVPTLVWRAEGRTDAERDIANGSMKWKIYGHFAGLTDTDQLANEQLRKRLGVELEAVAQCVVTSELVERTKGYNGRIQEEVERRHGAGAIEQVWEEAAQNSRGLVVAKGWSLWAYVTIACAAGGLWVSLQVQRSRRK